ncbi:MAG: hypothetical protein WAM97_08795, partial [Acidimicrobiales bacterium]
PLGDPVTPTPDHAAIAADASGGGAGLDRFRPPMGQRKRADWLRREGRSAETRHAIGEEG